MATSSWILAKTVVHYLNDATNYYYSIPSLSNRKQFRVHLLKLIQRIQYLLRAKQICSSYFFDSLLDSSYPVDVLCLLYNFKLIDCNAYFLQRSTDIEYCQIFGEEVAQMCCQHIDSVFQEKVCKDMVECMDVFYIKHNNDVFINYFVDKCYSLFKNNSFDRDIKESLRNRSDAFVNKVLLSFLTMIIKDSTEIMCDAWKSLSNVQPSIAIKDLCSSVASLNLEIFMPHFKSEMLKALINNEPINYNYISNCFHSLSVIHKNIAYTRFKQVINEIIEKALCENNKNYLYGAILLGRIITHEGSVSYLQWYSSTFCADSHRPLNTVEKAQFFLTSMGEIVDIEPASYLKIQIHKAVSVPASCQADLAEYLQLAKAKLMSMNESVEMGFFENSSNCSTTENDVICVVKEFDRTGKLSSKFLAALTFRRQYFEKNFLPVLLKKCPGKYSTNHIIIRSLHDLGKISNAAYCKHEGECV